MKRILIVLTAAILMVALAACSSGDKGNDTVGLGEIVVGDPGGGEEPAGNDEEPGIGEEEPAASSDELNFNWALLENIGKPIAEILRNNPDLKPQEFSCIEAGALAFGDPRESYAYVFFVSQYLDFDNIPAGMFENQDILCTGIYTTVKEMFPDFEEGSIPEEFFNKPGVVSLIVIDPKDYGFAHDSWFMYEDLSFSVWGGTADSPAVLRGEDYVLAINPQLAFENEELINSLLSCAPAKIYLGRAREP